MTKWHPEQLREKVQNATLDKELRPILAAMADHIAELNMRVSRMESNLNHRVKVLEEDLRARR